MPAKTYIFVIFFCNELVLFKNSNRHYFLHLKMESCHCKSTHSELSAGKKDSFHSGSEPVSVKRAKEDFVTVAGCRDQINEAGTKQVQINK